MNDESNEQWTLYSVVEYISENFVGIILLILAFFIIYFVDHINQLNAMIFAPQLPFPHTSSPQMPNIIKSKSKKLKK